MSAYVFSQMWLLRCTGNARCADRFAKRNIWHFDTIKDNHIVYACCATSFQSGLISLFQAVPQEVRLRNQTMAKVTVGQAKFLLEKIQLGDNV
mmetsp:Transcript_18323/g.36497  ORF Transcript_18323/g.36497 Transcript_18323/m.36497 type:complete len:93 (+) Transcript_18323:216-494(+)